MACFEVFNSQATSDLDSFNFQKLVWHWSAFASLILYTFWSRWLTEVGHSVDCGFFEALCVFVLSMCHSVNTTHKHAFNSLAVLWRLASFLCCHSTMETLNLNSVGVLTKSGHLRDSVNDSKWLKMTQPPLFVLLSTSHQYSTPS